MPVLTIEIEDRDLDIQHVVNAIKLAVSQKLVAELTIDEPSHGNGVFHGDVVLEHLDPESDILQVREHYEDGEATVDERYRFHVRDIRRISFY